jgi:hypothetical protein
MARLLAVLLCLIVSATALKVDIDELKSRGF